MYTSYYCQNKFVPTPYSLEEDKNLEQDLYDSSKNKNYLLLAIISCQVLGFFVMYLIHYLKSVSEVGFDTDKEIKFQKKALRREAKAKANK